MANVYLSYVQENEEKLSRLLALLDEWECSVTTPVFDNGVPVLDEDAIRGSDVFIPCFSAAYSEYCGSRKDSELNSALRQLDGYPVSGGLAAKVERLSSDNEAKPEHWFVPVLLEPCSVPAIQTGAEKTLLDFPLAPLFLNKLPVERRLYGSIHYHARTCSESSIADTAEQVFKVLYNTECRSKFGSRKAYYDNRIAEHYEEFGEHFDPYYMKRMK